MTVQGEQHTVSQAVPAAVDQQFTEIYGEHYERLRRYISFRSPHRTDLAEDFAQEAFIDLYQMMQKGTDPENPYFLLCHLARNAMGAYWRLKKNSDQVAVDLGDPVNTPIIATGHAYAPHTPELAHVSRELEQAMEVMTAASQEWREKNKAWNRRRVIVAALEEEPGRLTPEVARGAQVELEEADRAEAEALETFRSACARVGALRAELEAAGGGCWNSSSGMPASLGTRPNVPGSQTDPTATHCLQGHLLDRANTYFYENGKWGCRTCRTAQSQAARPQTPPANPGRRSTKAISAEVLEQIRQALSDPTYLTKRVEDIAREFNISSSTLRARIKDSADLRRAAKAKAAELVSA